MGDFISVADAARKWGVSERSVRNYCAQGRVPGSFIEGKTWRIPIDAPKPARKPRSDTPSRSLAQVLREEKQVGLSGGIYHRLQIDLTYNSNHIEGSRLTHDQTRFIFETSTVGIDGEAIRVDDIIETVNHFRCIDTIIDSYNRKLSQTLIKNLHRALKAGTKDASLAWFAVGDYKKLPNEVGGRTTTLPEDVETEIAKLLDWYEDLDSVGLNEILEFHWRFERIHPFQDGNGRVGRLIMLKECLRHDVVPFIITDSLKDYYYRGLNEFANERGYLEGTALTAQDQFKELMDYFRIPYRD